MALAHWTQQEIIDQLDTGYYWDTRAILYRFPTSGSGVYGPNGETLKFSPLNPQQKDAARLAFSVWSDFIAKPIAEVNQLSHIDIANSTYNTDYAHAYYPPNSSIWFNRDSAELQSPVVGQYSFEVYLHEIGHTLGLDHMGSYNGIGEWVPSSYQDSSVFSIMSYFGPEHHAGEGEVAWANWTIDGVTYAPQTPMLNDVMAIQQIYGASTESRSNNTTYGFNTNFTGHLTSIFDFNKNLYPILTIYDAGGVDTLDLSGWHSESHIDLTPGAHSDCNGMTNNLSIAYSCLIENLITGSGNDVLVGNHLANSLLAGNGDDILEGGLGNDFLDGGLGYDLAVFSGNLNEFRVGYGQSNIQVIRNDVKFFDSDTLINIEGIRFNDMVADVTFARTLSAEENPLLSFTYKDLNTYALDGNFTLVDKLGNKGILVYEDATRLQLKDLMIGADLGKGEAVGQVYRLYLSVLGRNPIDDPVGCGFWVDKLDRDLTDIEGLVGTFLESKEFIDRFGATTSTNESFVNLLYLNLLGRDGHPDPGFQFWKSILDNNLANRSQVVVGFMESPENVGNIAQLIGDHATFKTWVEG